MAPCSAHGRRPPQRAKQRLGRKSSGHQRDRDGAERRIDVLQRLGERVAPRLGRRLRLRWSGDPPDDRGCVGCGLGTEQQDQDRDSGDTSGDRVRNPSSRARRPRHRSQILKLVVAHFAGRDVRFELRLLIFARAPVEPAFHVAVGEMRAGECLLPLLFDVPGGKRDLAFIARGEMFVHREHLGGIELAATEARQTSADGWDCVIVASFLPRGGACGASAVRARSVSG